MSTDTVGRFLAALEAVDPDAGYMVIDREPSGHLEVEASEYEKQFPGGRTPAVLVHAARLVREGHYG